MLGRFCVGVVVGSDWAAVGGLFNRALRAACGHCGGVSPANTSDNTSDNTGANTSDNTAANNGGNTGDYTGDSTGDNADNTGDSTGDNADNTGDSDTEPLLRRGFLPGV